MCCISGESIEFKAHQNGVRAVHFSPDEKMLATGSDDKTVKLWTIHRHKFISSFSSHKNWVRFLKNANMIS